MIYTNLYISYVSESYILNRELNLNTEIYEFL